MIWAEKWWALSRWADRLPWWQAIVLLPPLTPVLLLAAACACPKTTAFAALTLIAVYIPLVWTGVVAVNWSGVLTGLGRLYVACIGLGVLSVLQAWSERALECWTGQKSSAKQARTRFWLWDRDIDG
jgi:hypothetical protein